VSGPAPTVVWLDGNLRDPEVAAVHWSDHGVTVGPGLGQHQTHRLADDPLGAPEEPSLDDHGAQVDVSDAEGGELIGAEGWLRLEVLCRPRPHDAVSRQCHVRDVDPCADRA